MAIRDLTATVELLTEKVQSRDNILTAQVELLKKKVMSLDNIFTAQVAVSMDNEVLDKIGALIDEKLAASTGKIATLEDNVKSLTERLQQYENKEAVNSKADGSNGATSNDMSWLVQCKDTSNVDPSIRCVVKNAKPRRNRSEKVQQLKKPKNEPGAHKVEIPHLRDEDLSDYETGFGLGLDAIAESIKKLDSTPLPKRVPQLAHTQRPPFVGNSTVKRIISGITLSSSAYDPFAGVEKRVEDQLLDFMQVDDMESYSASASSMEFYKKITTPRSHWPTETYGWLNTSQICAGMHMFHKRSTREPSPYHSSRIAFLDQWFVSKWVSDYKDFSKDKDGWVFPDYYKQAFNGTYPDVVTDKKWLIDVDHLYACHFVNGNHWVALDIDLVKWKIHVHDSILSIVEDDKEIRNLCRPFSTMIPYLLDVMVPETIRKFSKKQLTVKRLRNVPQNKDPGDCGVYALKYIECLAIGCTSEGLSDRIIQSLRFKLAAEIYDEVTVEDDGSTSPAEDVTPCPSI